jgi:hypothetical protein
MSERAEGWLIMALNDMAEELESKAREIDADTQAPSANHSL